MRLRKVISTICLVVLMTQNIPVSAMTILSENNDIVENDNSQELHNEILNEEIIDSENMTKDEDNKDENNGSQPLDDKTSKEEVINSENIVNNESDISKEEISNSESTEKKEDSINAITKITGSENITIYLGEEINYKDGIKATDTNGNDITDLVTVEGKVDNSKPGTYELKYSVKDELGNIANLVRKVKVIEKNTFNFYVEKVNEVTKETTKETLFTFYLDNENSKFVVENQSSNMIYPSKENEIALEIKVIDKDNKEKLRIELLGKDTGNSNKLEALKELKYSYGDYIQIKPMKIGLSIEGSILGDINTEKEDYSDGIDNLDYINNVRFKIVEDGIEAIYNEAPVINGLSDIENSEEKSIDPIIGISVTDDHDGVIDNSKVKIDVAKKEDSYIIYNYTVEDSWGRSTSGTRKIPTTIESNEENISENKNVKSLDQNIIKVEGVSYFGNTTERFKIKLDPSAREIQIIDADGKVMSNTIKGEYFKFELYDRYMELKTSVTLLGTDKSDSTKLNAIKNYLFEEGDYIAIWHAESDSKLKIEGSIKTTVNQNGEAVADGGTVDYSNGLQKADTSSRRFRITKLGLEEVKNEAPIIEELPTISIERGGEIDLLTGVLDKINDDFDEFNEESIENGTVSLTHTTFDNTKVGNQTIVYTATDSWGRTSTKSRTVTVTSENPLDTTYIEFMNSEGGIEESLFKIGLDPVLKEIVVKDIDSIPDTQVDSTRPSSIFKLKIYTQGGVLQKTLNIKGTDRLKTVLRKINGYKYSDTDRIELWSNNPKNIKVIGAVVGNIGENAENYTDGIDDHDYMRNVRFEITPNSLKYIYNEAPKFIIDNDLTVIRNGNINYLDGIRATDDHDNESEITSKITHGTVDTNTIGEKYVEYSVTDSWGRSTLVKRKVIVYPYNELEYNYINVKNDETNETILSINFDEETKKFKVNKVDSTKLPHYLTNDDMVFELSIIRSNGQKETVSLTKADIIRNIESKLDEINNLSYQYEDYISLRVYDPVNGIYISGNSSIILGGFSDDDQMYNSRFKIKPEGLEIEYNIEPRIDGLHQTLYIYKGDTLTPEKAMEGILIEDDKDGTINLDSNRIKITDVDSNELNDIDTDRVTEIQLYYEVTDSWGRSTGGYRVLSILSKSVSNDIEFYDESGNTKLFSLKYNPVTHEFNMSRDTQNITTTKSTKPKSTQYAPAEEIVFKLGVYNANGVEVGVFELSESDISNNNFTGIENISVYDDYYFSVWSNNPERIKIQGYMTGNDKLGELENQEENYADGINDSDNMDNVRFKMKTDGLEAVYNKAPKIYIKSKNILTAYAGDPIDYLSNVVVEDDYDGVIPTENVKVDIVEEDREESLIIGENTIRLTVNDSWGKETSIERDILILNGIEKNNMIVYQHVGPDTDKEDRDKVLEMKFNADTMQLDVSTYDRKLRQLPNGSENIVDYFIITVKDKDGNIKPIVNDSTMRRVRFNSEEEVRDNDIRIIKLREFQFDYDDTIEITHRHTHRFAIEGNVKDAREDYSDGTDNPEHILNVKFKVTKSGLEAIYTDPDENNVTGNKVMFGPMAPEEFPFKIEVDTNNRIFRILNATNTSIWYKYSGVDVYKLTLIDANGEKKLETTLQGRDTVSTVRNDGWDNYQFEYGDALHIWHLDPSRSIIKGIIKDQKEDYSNGVDNPDYMNHVVFKLTADGVQSIYNEAPVIHGVEDIDIYQGQPFDEMNGVSYTDDHDNGYLVTNVTGTVDENTLGEQIITYTATDRWGKTTTVERKITVRPNLYKNIFKVFSDENISETVFEIGFNTVDNKYRVFNQKNNRLSNTYLEDTAFVIEIDDEDGNEKVYISLKGSDRGDSPILNELNEVTYSEGDIIRVYRSNLQGLSIVGNVTGDIPSEDDMSDDMNKFEYMTNVGYEVNNEGLEAIYNHAPIIENIIEDSTISKGTTINLLDGLEIKDDMDELDIDDINVYINGEYIDTRSYTFNRLGTFDIAYALTDSWDRTSMYLVTITVESKVRENSIEVYGPNQNLAFKFIFDTTENKFIVTNNTSSNIINSVSNQNKYFEMIVRNIKGEVKYTVTLNGDSDHDRAQLASLHEAGFSRYDTISLYGELPETVKIQGDIIKSSILRNYNYANGFGNNDRYSEVRFKITDDGLEEMVKKNPTISGIAKKTIKRGDDIDLLEGVLVDVHDENNQDYVIEVDDSGFNNLVEGDYTITYIVTNSWGLEVRENRIITVEPRTELETVKLNLKNTRNQNILTIGFNSIDKKLRVIHHTENATIDANDSNVAFAINAYDSLGNTLGTIEIKGNQIITQDIVDRLNNFAYIEGYRISIWSKNPTTHMSVEGNIKDNPKNETSGLTEFDKMENGRFEILSYGLEYIYNKAPEITGGDGIIDYYKGSILSTPSDISVSDDHDTISNNQVTINDDQVDYDELGEYDITYIVEDTWGRVGTKDGKINVISSIGKNEINIFTTTDNPNNLGHKFKAFGIKFERKTDTNKIIIENPDTLTFNPNGGTDRFMTINIHNENGEILESCELFSNENAAGHTELNKLNGYEFDLGGYISIDGITNNTKKCVKIVGTVVNQKEDYSNGIDELYYIDNVRFKVTDFGLESVYNEAPQITIDSNIQFNYVKGDDIPYMRGVKLRDDHDNLTSANVEVTWNPEEIPSEEYEPYNDTIKGVAKVGVNTLHYKVTDSWGRTCEGSRTVNLTNGILDNEVIFRTRGYTEAVKFRFVKESNNQENEVTLKVDVLNTTETIAPGGYSYYYTVKITLNNENNDVFTRRIYSEDKYSNQFEYFNNLKLPYGSTIEFIDTGHPDRLIINGPVRDQREDYTDGATNPDNLRSIKFVVTDCGLKSVYVEKDNLEENQNIISLMSKESIPLQFKIDSTTREIDVYYSNHVTLYWELRTGENDTVLPEIEVFRMTLTGENGEVKADVSGDARDKGNSNKFRAAFHDRSYDIGDTLTIWHYTPSRVSIKGKKIKGAREDYSNGVDNSANLTEAVFKLTEDGLEAIYKDPPEIRGVKDAKVLVGEKLDLVELTSEIEAIDNIDGVITDSIQFDDSAVNTDEVGMYEITYDVTNSNDRTSRKVSTILVYDNPKIVANSKSVIELNSIENNDSVIKEYLKTAVDVSDGDDNLYGNETKLELLSHNVNPNEEGRYTATYRATDLYGNVTEETIDIDVTRTISVSVPVVIPFQVVTNLMDKNEDPFIAGMLSISNNSTTSAVDVSLKSFEKIDDSGELEIVSPDTYSNWNTLSEEETMTKMALGMYSKLGFNNTSITEDSPLWLESNINITDPLYIGQLSKATSIDSPETGKLSFVSKHGNKFIGGRSKAKFRLVFEFN